MKVFFFFKKGDYIFEMTGSSLKVLTSGKMHIYSSMKQNTHYMSAREYYYELKY